MRSSGLCMERIVVISYRHFGTTYWSPKISKKLPILTALITKKSAVLIYAMAEALNYTGIFIFTCHQFMDFHSTNIPYLCHLFIRIHRPKMTRLLNYKKKTGPEGFVDDPSHSAPVIHNLQSPYCNPVK